VLEITGLDAIFAIYEDELEALNDYL